MATLFIPQETLTLWSDDAQVSVDNSTLRFADEDASMQLIPAVHIVEIDAGDGDPLGLVGKVKTQSQLKEIDAEHYADSVIHGDTAYKVVEGFVGKYSAAQKAQPASAQAMAPAPVTGIPAPASTEGDAVQLSRLFLDTVSDD